MENILWKMLNDLEVVRKRQIEKVLRILILHWLAKTRFRASVWFAQTWLGFIFMASRKFWLQAAMLLAIPILARSKRNVLLPRLKFELKRGL